MEVAASFNDFTQWLRDIHIHGETLEEIYNGFESPPVYGEWEWFIPGIIISIIFVIARLISYKLILNRAKLFAYSRSKLKRKELNRLLANLAISKTNKQKQQHSDKPKNMLSKADTKEIFLFNDNITKFEETYFRVILLSIVYFSGLYVLFTENFFWDTRELWEQGLPQSISPTLWKYYSLQLGLAIYKLVTLFFEPHRKDNVAMMIHHWLTLTLLVGSIWLGYVQSGCVVFFVNDNCDLLIPLGKLSDYFGHAKMNIFFGVTFMLTWIPFRIVLYGERVLYSLVKSEEDGGGYQVWKTNPYMWFLVSLLFVIYLLQVYWTRMVFKIGWNKIVLKKKTFEDVREKIE